jgi:hypothetical protein
MTAKLQWLLATARRTTAAFLLLRLGVFLVTLAALLVAAPFPVVASRWAAALVLVALAPAAWPRTGAVTAVLLVAILGWLAATTVYGEPVGYFRLVALAALLYGAHVLAAVAAVIPNDAIVAPGALLRWLPRTGLLLAVTALVALLGATLPDLVGGQRFLVASLVGLALMAGLAYYLARLVNRS